MAFPVINPAPQFFDSSGSPLASGTIEFRDPDTNDLIDTYPTADDADAQTNANDNPLTLNARGEAADGLYLEDGVKYKITLKDADGATIWTEDDVRCPLYSAESIGKKIYPQTTAESNAGVTPTNYQYAPGDLPRYGAALDGVTDDGAAVGRWLDVGEQGTPLSSPNGTALCTTWTLKTLNTGIIIFAPGLTITGPDTNTDFVSFTTGPVKFYGVTFDTWGHNVGAGAITADTYFELVRCASNDSLYFFNHKDSDTTSFKVSMLVDGCIVNHSGIAAGTGTRGIRVFTEYEDVTITNSRFLDLNGSAITLGTNDFADQDVHSRAVITGNTFDGIIEPSGASEVHAIIVYGRNAVISKNTIKDVVNSSDGLDSEGIYTKCRYAEITDNTLINGGEDEAAINIKGSSRSESSSPRGHNVVCTGNNIIYSGTTGTSGIHIANEDVICANNIIEGADTYGIYTEAKTLDNIKILNNIIRKCTGESAIWIQNDGENLDIIGNTIDEQDHASSIANGYGIFVDPASAALSNVNIKDNTIRIDDGSSATSTVRAINFARDFAINNVTITNNRLIVSHSSATEYGINLSGAVAGSDWTIRDNDWTQVDANPFTNLGTSLPNNLDFSGVFEVTTTSGSAANLHPTLPVADNTAWNIEVTVIAMESDGSDRNLYKDGALLYKDGGALTQQGATYNLITAIESDAAWSISLAPSGGNIATQVTGATSTTINWRGRVEILSAV